MKSNKSKVIIFACVPYLLALILFYSLAIHMHLALDYWPQSITVDEFPPALLMHANIQGVYMTALFFFTVIVSPAFLLICLLLPRWRHLSVYCAVQGLGLMVFFGLMDFAPDGYLNWWWLVIGFIFR